MDIQSIFFSFIFIAIIGSLSFIGLLLAITISITNPFKKFTVVKSIFSSQLEDGQLTLYFNTALKVEQSAFARVFSWIKSGSHIFKNSLFPVKPVPGATVEEIIEYIHKIRFQPHFPFLISGDHFSMFYPRNLGVFYHPMVDSRVALNDEDWLNREKKYLQSTAYALEAFSKAGFLSTTIVPSARRTVTLIQIYAYPSDTLYGILHALKTMIDPEYMEGLYPFKSDGTRQLHTVKAAKGLIKMFADDLRKLYAGYREKVYDEDTGFIRKGLRLSSSLDMKIRSSSFYDNVVFWKATELMQDLGLLPKRPEWLAAYKKRILEAFWNEEGGYFIDDLSPDGLAHKLYSSDWLIVLMTGFLNPTVRAECAYFERTFAYIEKHKLNKPFPLKVVGAVSSAANHGIVTAFVPNYQDNAIWSNWGMQYIKAAALLYAVSKEKKYLKEAEAGVKAYRNSILEYRGYPEVYDGKGKLLRNFFYKSLLRLGWVIDFEHAQAMVTYWREQK